MGASRGCRRHRGEVRQPDADQRAAERRRRRKDQHPFGVGPRVPVTVFEVVPEPELQQEQGGKAGGRQETRGRLRARGPQRQQQMQRGRGERRRQAGTARRDTRRTGGSCGPPPAPRPPSCSRSPRARSCRRRGRPSTVTRWPDRMRSVASATPTTQGRPNSRATIAPCESRPPRSITRPDTSPNTGAQPGSVLARHQHVSGAEASGVAHVAEDRRRTGCGAPGSADAGQRRRGGRTALSRGPPVRTGRGGGPRGAGALPAARRRWPAAAWPAARRARAAAARSGRARDGGTSRDPSRARRSPAT